MCNSGHSGYFTNSTTSGKGKWKVPTLNLFIIVYMFLTGLQFDKVQVCMLNIWMMHNKTWFRHFLKNATYSLYHRVRTTDI